MLRTLTSLVLLSSFLVLGACGGPTEYALVGSARAAGSDGTVTIDADEFGNFELEVEIEHLPPPQRLGDGLVAYVVWIIPAGHPAQRAGVLAYDEDDRSGHFRTHTNSSDFTLRITAERSPTATDPGEVTVTTRRIQAVD